MSEDEAFAWLNSIFGDAAVERLQRFTTFLLAEAEHQNLIAPSTKVHVWSRHVADSAQLLRLAGDVGGTWLDIGSGAGLPGLVVAILRDAPVCLAEPRARRAQFLTDAVAYLALHHVSVIQSRVEQIMIPAAVISARAVAGASELFGAAGHCSSAKTIWLLPKGRQAAAELAVVRESWRGVFHVEQSITEPSSSIIMASNVARR